MPPARPFQNALKLSFGLGLIGALYWAVDTQTGWPPVWAYWSTIGPWTLIAALLAMSASHALRALRLRALLSSSSASWFEVFDINIAHTALNNLLPMRSGEAALPVLLKQRLGYDWRDGIGCLAVLRILDVMALAWLATMAATHHDWRIAAGLTVLWCGACFWGLSHLPTVIRWLPQRLHPRAISWPNSPRLSATQLGLTLLAWSCKGGALVLLCAPLAEIALGARVAAVLGGELSSVSPVHGPAGFGSYEAGFAAPLAILGTPLEQILPVAINVHLFVLIVSVVLAVISGAIRAIRSPAASRHQAVK